jgi:hypothetical protein
MLRISEGTMDALRDEARRNLRPSLLAHWFEDLHTSGDAVGPDGREEVLREVEALAVEDPELGLDDLMMIADLRLVALAGEVRKAQLAGTH